MGGARSVEGPGLRQHTSREARKECCVGRAWAEGWMLAGNPEQGLALVRCPERLGLAPALAFSCASSLDIVNCGWKSSSLQGDLEELEEG